MFPYERIVQWAAGPASVISGWLAVQVTNHFNIFGTLGLGRSQVGHAIYDATTFAVGAGVTYAAHHKWLDNLAYWWKHAEADAVPVDLNEPGVVLPDRPESARTPDPVPPVSRDLGAPAVPPVSREIGAPSVEG